MKIETVDNPEQNMTTKRLQSLYELIERINSVHNLQELLEFLVDRALDLTGGRQGLLLLSDGHKKELQKVAVVRGEGLNDQQLERPLQLASTTVIKDTLEKGEPRLVVDLRVDERYTGLTSRTTHQVKKVRSVLAVPLKIDSQLVGLIYIDHPKRAVFGQADLDFLKAFGNQAAFAINRAREHQRQIDELTLLNTLSRSVVQVLDLDKVLTRIVQEANRMLDVETGSVILLNKAETELYFATSIAKGEPINIPTRLKKNQGIAGWVVTHGEPAYVRDVSQDPRWFGEVAENFVTRSLLCVPLQVNGHVVGALQVSNKQEPPGFGERDVTRLSAFAASATIAIENARLFQEARQARQLRTLNEVALALSSSLELETILNMGLEQSLKILNSHASAISLIDGQMDLPPVQVSRGLLAEDPNLAEHQIQEIDQIAALLLRNGGGVKEAFVVDDLSEQTDLEVDNLLMAGIRSLALAPIKVGNKRSGALMVMNRAPYIYNGDDIGLLISISRIIGLAAQNAIHYNQAHNQTLHLTYLSEIGSALTGSLDLQDVLKIIIEAVNAILETERTSVFLIDAETNELVLHYSNEGDAEIRLPAPWQGIAGWVASHDKPALVNDTQRDTRHLHQIAKETGYQARSILCVPLKVDNEVIGVVEVLNQTSKQQFNHYHQILLTELTRWAAIAIRNARLFDERIQAYQRLASEQQRRIAAETRGAMASVILDMAHTMNNVVGAIRVWASTLEDIAQDKPDIPLGTYQREMTQIRQNAEEAIHLISNMTDPLKQATIEPTNIHHCLADAIKSCWWPDTVTLRKAYGDDVPLVKANPKRLEAAFHNLLSNAIQALTEMGGHIEVATRRTPDGRAEIKITDNGPGVPDDLQESIFNPGVSGKMEGLGIGLWLVETFIEQFKGQIRFTSSESGTTFTVILQPVWTADDTNDMAVAVRPNDWEEQ